MDACLRFSGEFGTEAGRGDEGCEGGGDGGRGMDAGSGRELADPGKAGE